MAVPPSTCPPILGVASLIKKSSASQRGAKAHTPPTWTKVPSLTTVLLGGRFQVPKERAKVPAINGAAKRRRIMVVVTIFFTLLPLEEVMGYLKESQAPTPLGACNIVEEMDP